MRSPSPDRFGRSCATSAPASCLAGLRVLVVEDQMTQAMMVEDSLIDLGCIVVGPAANLASACFLAGTETIDVAMLDVNLGGVPVHKAAAILTARKIPFVFVTGSSADIVGQFPAVQKPFLMADLISALCAACAKKRSVASD